MMGIFKPMYNVDVNLVEKFLEIKEDLIENSNELFNRFEYYTKKYRGNRLNDINVGIFRKDGLTSDIAVQIFLRNKEGYIKNTVTLDYKGRLRNDELNVRLNG